jgi:antitoxin (DNA-binding transcriptional repressor) of toxin-antitoxin stability system
MRHLSLRDFRTRGASALKAVPSGETVLLSGQQGPAYFLVPVMGDVVLEDQELRRAMAKASLRESWRIAEAAGFDKLTEEDISSLAKEAREARKKGAKSR